MQLQFDTNPRPETKLSPKSVGLSADEVLDAISRFDAIGLWRVDLAQGLTYWSDNMFEIYGWAVREGPVDVAAAIEAYHPEDRAIVARCLEEAAKNNAGFRFVLRLKKPGGDYIWVKSCGLFRKAEDGSDEIFGYFEKFSALTRSVTILN
jgi:PAS domain-containing protein